MKFRKKPLMAAGAAIAVIGISAGTGAAVSAQTAPPLIYMCQGVQNGQDPQCANGQEFEVFDRNGAPIYSVGEFGGDQVYGDNRRIFQPGEVFRASMTESYTDPVTYYQQNGGTAPPPCLPGARWMYPAGDYTCTAAGTWTRALILLPAARR